jgi:hypothetical protein
LLIYGVVSVVTLWCIGDRFSYSGTSGIEVALVWLFLFLTLRSLTLASVSFSRLRDKLTEVQRTQVAIASSLPIPNWPVMLPAPDADSQLLPS